MSIFKSVLLGGMLLLSSSVALAQVSLSQNSSGSNVFSLVGKKDKACVYYDAQDFEVVKTTAGLFANDVKEVSGQILGRCYYQGSSSEELYHCRNLGS